ncbi:receptor-type tyrosine-protein phosphatase delta-like isoform X2 [Montipora foliosa]|uniref:receptor-type tyrosine-protein phosphatase delta-like isoform X2 n=1 Tax=Montipora foliosa TaxID=591990 RepID=UPI0035F1E588
MDKNPLRRIAYKLNPRCWLSLLFLVMVCSFSGAVPPEVTIDGTSEQFTIIGNEIQLTCHYNSSPAASEVQWQKDGRLISRNVTMENGTRGNITHFNESSIQLTIRQSISADAGNYTCLVINSLDNSSDTVVVVVKVKPDPPHVRIISTTSRTLAISWTAGFNGNSEITSYIVKISEDNQTFSDVNCQGLSNSTCVVSGNSTNATLEGLHPATMYYLKVFAINSIGQSDASSVVNATTDEEVPNAPPANVTGRNTSSTSILVQWDQVPVADRNGVILTYTVTFKMALPGGSEQTRNVTAPTTNATLMSLNKYTNYSITVFASTSKGGGNKSAPIIVTTDEDTPTAPPSEVQGQNRSSTSIFVSWGEVPEENKNGVILSYTVNYVALEDNGAPVIPKLEVVPVPSRNITLRNLNEHTKYEIKVAASTSKGLGIKSDPLIITTDQDKPNAPPEDLREFNTSSTSIFLQWDPVRPADQNGDILSYTVTYRALPDGPEQTLTAPTTHATLTGLNEYTNYSITVFASTIKGDGNISVPIIVRTDEGKPNAPPANVTGYNTSSTGLFVQWEEVPAADQNGVILRYTVTYTELPNGPEQTQNVTAPTTNAPLTSLNEYTNYSITVFASTIKGGGNVSAPIIVITDEDRPNAPPANVTGHNVSSTSIFVQWNEVPATDQNGVILSYTITFMALPNGSQQTHIVTAPTTTATLKGLNEYTNYSITVFASTIKGGGNKSAPIIVITDEDRPNAPPANVTGRNVSSTSIFVQWNEVPATDQNGVILSYTITFMALPNGSQQTHIVTAPTTTATLKGLNEYTNYSITVFASTIKGGGNKSAPIIVITDEDRPNAPPANVTGRSTGSTTIFVEWDQVPDADQNGVILGYTVSYKALSDGRELTKNVTDTEATLTDLNEYTNYSITVFASTVKGGGNISTPVIVITDEARPNAPPANVTGRSTGSTTIFVEWDQVPDADQNGVILGYTVSYKALSDGRELTKNVTDTEATLTDLNEYTNYSITVFASTFKGGGNISTPVIVITDEARPNAPPANVTGRSTGSTTIFVEWDQVPVADQNGVILGYTVSYKAISDGRELTKNVTDTEATLTDLNEYTNYSITVFASTVKGGGNISTPVIVITDEARPNAPPANVTGRSTGSTTIFVEWDQVPDADQNGVILGYTVSYKALSDGRELTKNVTDTEATLTDLNEYTNYSITVFASTVKGGGNISTPVIVITDEARPNAPPANVTGRSTGSTTIFVEWDQVPVADQNGVILGYTVSYKALSDGRELTKNVTDTEATLTDLNEYTNYSITVFASTVKGGGNISTPVIVITDEARPNAPPANVTGRSTGSTTIFVEWDQVPIADQNGVILGYTVSYKALSNGRELTKNVTDTEATLTDLNEYTNYSITVFASTVKGGGNISTPVIVITDEARPNAPPANVTGRSTGSTTIFVEWDQVPVADQNGVILGYTVSYKALSDGRELTKNVTDTEATLTDLNEYTNYSITVFASTIKGGGNVSQPLIILTDQDVPSAPPNELKAVDTTSTSILVQWGDVPDSDKNGIITSYTVRYQAITERIGNAPVNTTTVEAPAMRANLTDLIINVKYNISVLASTVEGDGPYSSGIEVQTNQSAPGSPPSHVRGYNTSSTTILVQWDEVPIERRHGQIKNYTVVYWRTGEAEEKKSRTVTDRKADLTDLLKYTDYSFEVFASTIKGGGPSSPKDTVRTDEDKPSASPTITELPALNSTSIRVKWSPVPKVSRHGIITRYTIKYTDKEKGIAKRVNITPRALETTITGLRQKALYLFSIVAATSKGDGPWSDEKENDTLAVPNGPPIDPDEIGTTTVTIPLNLGLLSNGETASYYQVIVVQLKERQKPGNPADYQKVVASYDNKKEGEPYITAEFLREVAEETFTIGDGKFYSRSGVTDSRRKRRDISNTRYRNGKLEDGTDYAAFQRSFAESGYSEFGPLQSFSTNNDYTAAIVAPIILLVVAMGVAGGIYIYRRRPKQPNEPDIPILPRHKIPGGSGIDNPNHTPGETIPVEEFEGHVRRLHANGDLLFSQEYSALRPTTNFTWNATLAQENRLKNRYNNIVAYDHSRVKLASIGNVPGSDYMNANFLDGYNKKKAYIATQGPLPETVDDFWRMVWEQNTKTIVMVTNLEERGRIKCFQYWPSEGGEAYGDIQVQLTETVELSDFTVRKFCMKKSNSRVERMISQYHYTVWPDHGVPSCPTSVLTFVRKASGANPPDAGPMVVHCSAGVGRTGTFIVVDAMLQRIAAEKTVDVFGYVMSLRCDRNFMVQVEEQYVFIHEVLQEAIHSGYTEVRANDLLAHIKNLLQVNVTTGQSEMEEEFARLGRGNAAPQSKFQAANMPYNKTKNRYANVLTFDDARVKLSVIPGIEGSDYINASFVDGYMMRRAFIATQAPIPDTIPDFWRMIWEQESSTVVMLSKETESGKVKVHRYWPAKQPANIGNLVVEMTSEMVYDDYTMREIKLTNTKESASRVIRQYHYTGWPDVGSPDSGTGLIDLIGQVQRWQQQSGNTTITVHCSAGVGRTGVFCALSILIERLKSEGVVDVFQTVKQLRSQRPAMVQTKEQYEFIYFALREYLDSFDAYSNFE